MPSESAKGIRREKVMQALESALPGLKLPRVLNWQEKAWGADIIALEAVLDAIQEKEVVVETVDYENMSKSDLEQLADERGVSVEGTGANGSILKADLIEALSNGNN